jgi:hypothetical protein
VSLYTLKDNVFQHPVALYFSHTFTSIAHATYTTQDTTDENIHSTKKNTLSTHAVQEKENILQNLGLNFKIQKKSVTVYKVQQFRQNNFNAPDDGSVGQNILCERIKTFKN